MIPLQVMIQPGPMANKSLYHPAIHEDTPGGGPEGAIAVVNADGSGFAQLTDTADGSSGSPDWSPDGTRIVFQRARDIYAMNADGTGFKSPYNDGNNQTPTWSSQTAVGLPSCRLRTRAVVRHFLMAFRSVLVNFML
jgi:hypothetical protein